jgi:hypothetical protein
MKILIHIIIIAFFGLGNSFGQSDIPFYEQIAFDYYQTDILESYPVEEKISVYRYFYDFHGRNIYFATPLCLKNVVQNDSKSIIKFDEKKYGQNYIESEKFELNFSDLNKRQFKIRNRKLGKYPRLFITYPRVMERTRIFINIVEVYESKGNAFHIEMDLEGNIIDWCKSDYTKIIIN